MATTIEIKKVGCFMCLSWLGTEFCGRKEYIPIKEFMIQKTNNTDDDFFIKYPEHTIYLKYSQISTTQPTDHTTLDELIAILLNYCVDEGDPDNAQLDAMYRLRVSNPCLLFEAKFRYDKEPKLFGELVANGGTVTYNNDELYVSVNTDTTNSSRAIFQTKKYINDTPGTGQFVVITAMLRDTLAVAENTAYIGYFDDENDKVDSNPAGSGYAFCIDGTGALKIIRRHNAGGTQTDQVVAQADWNMDQLDGTGTSLQTLDPTKINMFIFDTQGIGGRARVGVYMCGMIVWAHQFKTELNATPNTYATSLPIRVENFNSAIGVLGSSTRIYDAAVLSDGECKPTVTCFCCDSGSADKVVCKTGDFRPVVSIRLRAGRERATLKPKRFQLINLEGGISRWVAVVNADTLTAASFSDVNSVSSHAECDTTATDITIGSGCVIACGYVSDLKDVTLIDLFEHFCLSSDISGSTRDTLTIAIEYIKGTSRVLGSIEWCETE